ncbi:hypothetical protein VTO73DRAFT_2294 [Trametes versicolor]
MGIFGRNGDPQDYLLPIVKRDVLVRIIEESKVCALEATESNIVA